MCTVMATRACLISALEDLLAQVTEDNSHGEIETGPVAGREVW